MLSCQKPLHAAVIHPLFFLAEQLIYLVVYFQFSVQSYSILYENAPPLPVSLPSTGEGYREGVIFILRCARSGHEGYSE